MIRASSLVVVIALASLGYGQETPVAVADLSWRTITSPDKRVWEICLPQLVTPTLVGRFQQIGPDTFSYTTATREAFVYDLPKRASIKVPNNVNLIGLDRKRQIIYWEEIGQEGRSIAFSIATQKTVEIPQPKAEAREFYHFWMDGDTLIASSNKRQAKAWNGSTWVAAEPELRNPKTGPLHVVMAPALDSSNESQSLFGNVLQVGWRADTPGEVITTGVQEAYLDSSCKNLLFLSQEHLFICKVRELSAAEIEARNAAGLKQKAVMDAKQSALALLMMLNDSEDQMPENFDKSSLNPYLKDPSSLANFVFTYKGPKDFNSIEDPAGTEVGYVPGPGGRAVAYADGHVKWIPDKKT